MKVLVAEDEPMMRHLVTNLLRSWDYEVVVASNGADAQRILSGSDAPRLAVVDWNMPEKTGLDVVRELRTSSNDQYTYVLLLTAEAQKDRLLEALRAGCDDYITKPFDAKELEARLFVGGRIVQLQEQLGAALKSAEYRGTHDALTGALNRGAVLEALEREMTRSEREKTSLAAILLDVDHFKSINDMFGHLAGDEVLRQLVMRIAAVIRPYDTFGRYGGEEFVVLLPDCTLTDGVATAERICHTLCQNPFKVEGREIAVTVSAGVAVSDASSRKTQLLREADSAMYRAKAAGRNRVCAEGSSLQAPELGVQTQVLQICES
jgi:two-component system, cell cycle response regulator